jgi:hypothetical protein
MQSSSGEGRLLVNDCRVVLDRDVHSGSRLPMAAELGWTTIPHDTDDNFGFSLLHALTDADSAQSLSSSMTYLDSPVDLPTDLPTNYTSSALLHALDVHLSVNAISRSEFYLQISAIAPELLGPNAPLRAHTDGGSMATTTNRRDYLWEYRALSSTEQRPVLRVADARAHRPVGIGFLRVPTKGSKHGFHPVRCYYTPSLPATILSPSAMAREHHCTGGYTTTLTFDGQDCCVHLIRPGSNELGDIVIPQVLIHDLLFTLPLARNPARTNADVITHGTACDSETNKALTVSALTPDQLRILWHQRLGHMHSRRVATAYKYAEGVPKVSIASTLESCPVCMK